MILEQYNEGFPCPCLNQQSDEGTECTKHNRIWREGKLLQLHPFFFEKALEGRRTYFDTKIGLWITEEELKEIYKISDDMNQYAFFGNAHLDEEAGDELILHAKDLKARLNVKIDKILTKYGADSRNCAITSQGQILLKSVIDPTWTEDESRQNNEIKK